MRCSVLVRCVHSRLASKSAPDGRIDRSYVMKILGQVYHVPKKDRHSLLEELLEQGVIKDMNKFIVVVNKDIALIA